MKNYKVENGDIKSTLVLIQMESGKVVGINNQRTEENVDAIEAMLDDIENGNKIKSVGVKVELCNGDWIKTDGKSIASRNITDKWFIDYLSEVVEATKIFYLESLNTLKEEAILVGQLKMNIELVRLAGKYGYQ